MLGTLPPPPVPLKGNVRPLMDTSAPPLSAWPPKGHRKAQQVADGQTWQSVAMAALIPDPLDVIHFNFLTTDPRRVNTYLHHYVGCSVVAEDKKNFRFSSNVHRPEVVYWPPLGYRRTDGGLPFHAEVMVMLEQENPRYPDLTLGDHRVTRKDLDLMVEFMRVGRIGVRHVPGLIGAQGEWEPNDNVMKLKREAVLTPGAGKTIIHEATHAINDYKTHTFGRPIRVWQDEFLAFAAAALWRRARDNAEAETAIDDGSAGSIEFWALILAHYLRAGGVDRDGRLYVSKVDKDFADYRVPDTTINPVKELKEAIKRRYQGWNLVRKIYDGI
jgi:hypothetical protein